MDKSTELYTTPHITTVPEMPITAIVRGAKNRSWKSDFFGIYVTDVDKETREASAANIVRACNSFEDMRNALLLAVDYLASTMDEAESMEHAFDCPGSESKCLLCVCREALAKANGEQA